MTVNQISVPVMVAVPAVAYLITGDLRQTIITACCTAIGIVLVNVIQFR